MLKKKKWNVLNELRIEDILKILLENRGIKTAEERESFLHPKLEDVTIDSVSIDRKQLEKALQRIQKAIDEKEHIVVFGDYDVDGITGTAILWETLYALKANVTPYIPDRVEEGYGLSVRGIDNAHLKIDNIKLIITVDNGIVANEAVAFANEQGIDVIITDHHMRGEKDPDAFAIVHTTKLCGAGVGYLLSQEIINSSISQDTNPPHLQSRHPSQKGIKVPSIGGVADRPGWVTDSNKHLELVALATIADLVPLTGSNRTLVKYGLEKLRNTKRAGLQALYQEAGIDPHTIGVYEIGHIIGPRLNAMGRMASAMDSLRLLCTKDKLRAQVLADKLGRTNKERQLLTQGMTEHALTQVKNLHSKGSPGGKTPNLKNLLFIYDESYEQGVIGLVASKLVETYYRPAIVLSKGEKHSKASARSISGFNIIEFIRLSSHLLINAGGHPMAAGFTVETAKLPELQEAMELQAQEQITEALLTRTVTIDCELPLEAINQELYEKIQTLSPFGMKNPEPIFVSRNVVVNQIRAIGQEGKHLKLELRIKNQESRISAIAFNFGEYVGKINIGDTIDIAYVIDENEWNGRKNLQLKVKDLQI
jgi:single-stranded-DNA-specific exonuclease